MRLRPSLDAEGRQSPRGLPNIPLDRMKAEAPVGDVGDAKVLAGRKQIPHPQRNEGAEGNLKGERPKIDDAGSARAWMQVDPVRANAHAVFETGRAVKTR